MLGWLYFVLLANFSCVFFSVFFPPRCISMFSTIGLSVVWTGNDCVRFLVLFTAVQHEIRTREQDQVLGQSLVTLTFLISSLHWFGGALTILAGRKRRSTQFSYPIELTVVKQTFFRNIFFNETKCRNESSAELVNSLSTGLFPRFSWRSLSLYSRCRPNWIENSNYRKSKQQFFFCLSFFLSFLKVFFLFSFGHRWLLVGISGQDIRTGQATIVMTPNTSVYEFNINYRLEIATLTFENSQYLRPGTRFSLETFRYCLLFDTCQQLKTWFMTI